MNNDAEEKLNALFAAARTAGRDTTGLEFGFETRLAARLREENGGSVSAWAWRLCPFFAALALAVAWWGYASVREDAAARIAAETTPENAEQVLLTYVMGDER
jgi:hypothetical protein